MSPLTSGRGLGLVLAGGGVAGIAWELGVLRGIADVDRALADRLLAADVVIGTSAGSTVGAQITSGTPLEDLHDAQLTAGSAELEVEVDLQELVASMARAAAGATSTLDGRRRTGALALAADTVDEAARRAAVRARLPVTAWPERTLLIPAVDAHTGEVVVLDRTSGVDLVDAVTASCAVPGVWPPATLGTRRFMDGGVRSSTNADLAAGCDPVVVITPTAPGAPTPWGDLGAELETLSPATAHVVHADPASLAAFGDNPLSPRTRAASAVAGRDVGRARAPVIRQHLAIT